jgi:hypothetical protein
MNNNHRVLFLNTDITAKIPRIPIWIQELFGSNSRFLFDAPDVILFKTYFSRKRNG